MLSAMRAWVAAGVVAALFWGGDAHAGPLEDVLARIDAVLAQHEDSHRKPGVEEPAFCGDEQVGPGLGPNRLFLCDAMTRLGRWVIDTPRFSGGRFSTELEVFRFNSPEAATKAKNTAARRYFVGRRQGYREGGISWCWTTVLWSEELVVSIQYGCNLDRVSGPIVGSLELDLKSWATPHGDLQVLGVSGRHSGWVSLSSRLDRATVREENPEPEEPLFVRVKGVAQDDVLNTRLGPDHRAPQNGSLQPGQRCVRVTWRRKAMRWWQVQHDGGSGFVNRRFIEVQNPAECLDSSRPRPERSD